MPVIALGLNHKTAPLGLLGRLAIPEENLAKALHQLSTYEQVLEGVVLSTCNRIEVYAVVTKFHRGAQELRNFLAEFRHIAPEDFTDHLYTYHDDAAIRHLFRVASGIDSMVVGESEILGQVRRAFHAAEAEGLVHRRLGRAFRQALKVGKAARAETDIARNPVSVSSAAVDLARRTFEERSLAGKRALLVGAGKMGRLALQALGRAGVSDIVVVNRREERAVELARRHGAVSRPFEDLEDALTSADIVICSTTAPSTVIDVDVVRRVCARREQSNGLLMIDIAVPNDIDPEVRRLEGVTVRDLDDLARVVETSLGSRMAEVSKVEAIVAGEVARFMEWERADEVAPLVSRLVAQAEAARGVEMERFGRRGGLDDATLEAVDRLTKRLVAKLLHEPINRAKQMPSSQQGKLHLAALRELFELDED
ncbi:MAG TPA: glutamyl-tRNA reductase [Actinomycetota bacterium]|nr:glutamyl-tRNA reductase [Actinomycetota bacterium]